MADEQLYLIAGLGNPGKVYSRNRHNAGFMVLDQLALRNKLVFDTRRLRAEIARGTIDGRQLMLAKPQTYMNESGQSIGELVRWYKVDLANVLVIYDELDLPPGTLRLRAQGSAGGHNGVKSLIQHLGTQNFNRIRIGIGRPGPGEQRDYVLNNFTRQEQPIIEQTIDLAAEAAECWLREGIVAAMNKYNQGVRDGNALRT